jgi:hypothetical protein
MGVPQHVGRNSQVLRMKLEEVRIKTPWLQRIFKGSTESAGLSTRRLASYAAIHEDSANMPSYRAGASSVKLGSCFSPSPLQEIGLTITKSA